MANPEPETGTWLRRGIGVFSLVLVLVLIVIHWFQFDILAAVTLVPPWMWLVPAVAMWLLSFRSSSRMLATVTIAFWFVFVLLFAEESRSLLRYKKHVVGRIESLDELTSFRVVTLNCNVGNSLAAVEPARFGADIVLLQESPGSQRVSEIAEDLFGEEVSYGWGGDTSIIVRGELEQIHVDKASHFAHVSATLASGQRLDVVSLRLSSPVFRLDFWSSGFWIDHLQKRRHHRRQLQEIRDHLEANQNCPYLVIGGDFNAVGNDGSFNPTFNGLQDSFLTAGAGWGNTGTNESPLFRVDQIWSTKNIRCILSRAYRTKHSDHRMVVSDFEMADSL